MASFDSEFFDYSSFSDSGFSSPFSSPLPSPISMSPPPPPVSLLLNLPIELLELIASNLPSLDLFSLIQTNKSLAYCLLHSALKKRIDKNRTLLHHIALNGHTSVMKHLLNNDLCVSFVNEKDDTGSTPLHLAAGHEPGIVEVLLGKGAQIDACNHARETPIFCAVEAGITDIVCALISNGADVSKREQRGRTVLEKAVMFGKKDVIQVLREKEGTGGFGYKELNSATASGFVEAVQKMMREGVNPFQRKGCTALKVIACWRNGGLVAEEDESSGEEGVSPEILVKRKRERWEQLEDQCEESPFEKRLRYNAECA